MRNRWTTEQAHAWYAEIDPIRGCNYLPRSAINSTEMWQAQYIRPADDQSRNWDGRDEPAITACASSCNFLSGRRIQTASNCAWSSFYGAIARRSMKSQTVLRILFDDCAFRRQRAVLRSAG